MLSNLIDLVFGCTHKHISFPQTARKGQRRTAAATQTGTYVVCLDCGKEFAYDWQQMRIIAEAERPPAAIANAAAQSYAGK